MSARRRLKLALLLLSATLLLESCQTAEVLVSAPEDFWLTVEQIPVAVIEDFAAIIEWLAELVL